MNRILDSIKQGAVGGIAGFIIERGLENATGMDFINGVFEIAGATLGIANANKDLITQSYNLTKSRFNKEPKDVTDEEWNELRKEYPRVVEYLEKALSI